MEDQLLPLTTGQWILELIASLLMFRLGYIARKSNPWTAWAGILAGVGSATFIFVILLIKLFS
jgi:hypothetical protein